MSSSSLSEKEVDQIVLNYLKKRGFTQAEAALKQEQQGKQQSMESMAFRQDMEAEMPATISNFIMNYQNAESSSPFRVSKYYSILREWVASALEMYQGELFSLLYPIFVHCYLEIVARGHSDEARTFMHLYKKDHLELHGDEIQRLQNVLTPDQMKENELVEMYKKNRFTVSISRFTLELLVSYLHENRFMFILSILNQYINFKSINALPPQPVEEYLAITGKPERERKTINERELYWGLYEEVLPQSVLNALQQYRAKQKEIASTQEIENLESATKRQKSEKPSPLLPPEMEKPKQMSQGVRLPRMTEQMEYDLFEDLSKRVALSSTALPSVCFYTAFNTYHGMNTMNFAQDGSICVAGFSDSTLRLWDIKNAGKSSSTANNNNNSNGGRSDVRLLVGHSAAVFGCSVSPDNNWVLSSSSDKTVRLWNVQTGNSMVAYKGHNYPVWDVEFSALGYYFATASHDKTARLWATDNIFPLRIFAGHLSDVNCVKFHPNCNYVATGSSDKSIRLWDINTASSVRIFTGLFGPVNCLALSPDGKYIAAADDQRIMVWDLATSRRLHTFTGHTRTIWSVDFSVESTLLASSGADNTVRIWDLTTAKQQQGKQESHEAIPSQPAATTEETPKAPEEEKPKPTASPELLQTFHTKETPTFRVKFTRRNLLLAGGAFIAKKPSKEPVTDM